jgi:hypothetical protein
MKHRWLVFLLFAAMAVVPILAANDDPMAKSVQDKMTQKNLVYFVARDTSAKNVFVGIQYLQGLAFIAIDAVVEPENVEFLEEDLAKKDYRKVYKDLTMLKGNSYIMMFDSGMNNLTNEGDSRDFIKENEKVYYLDKGYQENGFASSQEYDSFVLKNREKYSHMLKVIDQALK